MVAKPKVNVEDDFDMEVLTFIKTVYKQSKYNKNKLRNLFHPNVVEAVMKTVDITERDLEE